MKKIYSFNEKGFTIKELLITLGVMGILMSVLIPSISGAKMASRDRLRVGYVDQVRLTLEEYRSRCGEYPATLLLSTNNGCPTGVSLGTFISAIPELPALQEASDIIGVNASNFVGITTEKGFIYAGLSRTNDGRCFDYHLGVELEKESSAYLSKDHDISRYSYYTNRCAGSQNDFGTSNTATDDAKGFYDFSSRNPS